jgi:catechol 2,3-dioxygenase
MNTTSTTPTAGTSGSRPAVDRLPDQTRVGGVLLQVSDLPRSLAYYNDVLGLRTLAQSSESAALGAPASVEPLVTLQAVTGTHRAHRRGAFGLFHFAILLPDRAALGSFLAHLAQIGVYAGMSDHKVSEALYLSDPDGLGIEVYADRPRSTWHYDKGQLVMATDPLDVDDLLAAAAGHAWVGMPARTTMGHMHLHVGDLDRAADFYSRGLGFEITVSNYPGALFFSAGGYHHHLGTNTWAPGPAPGDDQARLLEWRLIVPSAAEADAVGHRLLAIGASAHADGDDWLVDDPWGTRVRIISARRPTA